MRWGRWLTPRWNPVASIELDGERYQIQYAGSSKDAYDRVLVNGEPVGLSGPRFGFRGIVRFTLRQRACAIEVRSGLLCLRGFSVVVEGQRVHAEGSIGLDDPVPVAARMLPTDADRRRFRLAQWFASSPALPALLAILPLGGAAYLNGEFARLERIGGVIELPDFLATAYELGGKDLACGILVAGALILLGQAFRLWWWPPDGSRRRPSQ